MELRMHHPNHGWTVVYNMPEVERLKAIGWQLEVQETKAPEVETPEVEAPRRGRPPKGK